MPEEKSSAIVHAIEAANPFDPRSLPIEPIGAKHVRDAFDCGEPKLNEYLRRYARQNHDNGIAKAFVVADGNKRVIGYYTLSSADVEFENLPGDQKKHIPRYPIPAMRIGRFAVDTSVQRCGLGERLLIDALRRVMWISEQAGVRLILVDAKDEKAKQFYIRYGFLEFPDHPMNLFLPIDTAKQLLQR